MCTNICIGHLQIPLNLALTNNLKVLAEESWLFHDSHFFHCIVLSNEVELLGVGRTKRVVRVLNGLPYDFKEVALAGHWDGGEEEA